MTAYNVVRLNVKPGLEDAFVNEHRKSGPSCPAC